MGVNTFSRGDRNGLRAAVRRMGPGTLKSGGCVYRSTPHFDATTLIPHATVGATERRFAHCTQPFQGDPSHTGRDEPTRTRPWDVVWMRLLAVGAGDGWIGRRVIGRLGIGQVRGLADLVALASGRDCDSGWDLGLRPHGADRREERPGPGSGGRSPGPVDCPGHAARVDLAGSAGCVSALPALRHNEAVAGEKSGESSGWNRHRGGRSRRGHLRGNRIAGCAACRRMVQSEIGSRS